MALGYFNFFYWTHFFLSRLFCNFAEKMEKMEKEGLLVVENEYVTMNCQENINALLTNWTVHWNYSKSSRLTYKTNVLKIRRS